jgi:hypothetical protein
MESQLEVGQFYREVKIIENQCIWHSRYEMAKMSMLGSIVMREI